MPTQQEEMRKRFRKIGDGSVRFIATRDEVLAFLQSEISLAVAQREKEMVEMIKDKISTLNAWTEVSKQENDTKEYKFTLFILEELLEDLISKNQ